MLYDKSIIRASGIVPIILLVLGFIFHIQAFIGVGFVVSGVAGMIYRTEYAWSYVHQQRKWFRINLDHRDIEIMQFLGLVIGPVFIAVGILMIFGILDLKL
jgi:hypothetical protein